MLTLVKTNKQTNKWKITPPKTKVIMSVIANKQITASLAAMLLLEQDVRSYYSGQFAKLSLSH